MIIECKKCGIVLAKNLKEVTALDIVNKKESEELVAVGYFYISGSDSPEKSFKDTILINESDLLNFKDHTDLRRIGGCCGLDGLDGMNKLCCNGHEVATEWSDCWRPHVVIFDKNCINFKEK